MTAGGLRRHRYRQQGGHRRTGPRLYKRIYRHYSQPDAWNRESFEQYRKQQKDDRRRRHMWTFEPHVAETGFRQMLAEMSVSVVMTERLDLAHGVRKQGSRISAIVMESGRTFRARVFIDATYEGDLMAKAGVGYTVGREANAQYGETLNGVQTRNA